MIEEEELSSVEHSPSEKAGSGATSWRSEARPRPLPSPVSFCSSGMSGGYAPVPSVLSALTRLLLGQLLVQGEGGLLLLNEHSVDHHHLCRGAHPLRGEDGQVKKPGGREGMRVTGVGVGMGMGDAFPTVPLVI